MKKIKVNGIEKNYTAYVKNDSFKEIGSLLENYTYKNIVIIYDSNINIDPLLELQVEKKILKVKTSEKAKSVEGANAIIDFLFENEVIHNNTLIIAIGGGVLLDLVGYVSSIYMRGIDVAYIPTTLMAMVDVCVGSKNAVHYKSSKNFLGTFKDPSFVLVDPSFLEKLPEREIKSGLCEVIKMSYVANEKVVLLLENLYDSNYNWEPLIFLCLTLKNEIILKDFKDKNVRKYLNFGHTFGHALEVYYDYDKYSHGEAVAIGMCLAYPSEKLVQELKKYDLLPEFDYDIDIAKMYSLMKHDKKRISNDSVSIITLKKRCSPVFDELKSEHDLLKKIERFKSINEKVNR